MRPYAKAYSAWLCASGCYRTEHKSRKPCTSCCGFTADKAKHLKGDLVAATKN